MQFKPNFAKTSLLLALVATTTLARQRKRLAR